MGLGRRILCLCSCQVYCILLPPILENAGTEADSQRDIRKEASWHLRQKGGESLGGGRSWLLCVSQSIQASRLCLDYIKFVRIGKNITDLTDLEIHDTKVKATPCNFGKQTLGT